MAFIKNIHNSWQIRLRQPDSYVIPTIVFLSVLFLTLAPAINVHFTVSFLTVNFAKIGIGLSIILLLSLVYSDLYQCLRSKHRWLQPPVLVCLVWLSFLFLFNLPQSHFPIISAKYLFRILASIFLGVLYALVYIRFSKECKKTTSFALCISLLIISMILFLDTQNVTFFEEFRTTYLKGHSSENVIAHGLYQNQNELAWAAVLHMSIIFWISPNHSCYRVMVMSSWVLCLWIIISSTSRSSFIGFLIVSIFSSILFFKSKSGIFHRQRWYIFWVISFIFLSGSVIIFYDFFPHRVRYTLHQVTSQFSFSALLLSPREFLEGLFQIIVSVRLELWKLAADKFFSSPFLGIGLGAFQNTTFPAYGVYHTTHNFLYTILVDQGLIGFTLLLIFCLILISEPFSLKKLFLFLVLPLSMLFDDLSPSYTFSSYVALWLGYLFANYKPTINWKAKFRLHFPTALRFFAKGFQLLFFFIAAKYVVLDIFGQFAYGLVVFSLILGPLLSLGVEQLLLRERVDLNPAHTASYRNTQFLVAIGTLGPLLLLGAALSFSINETILLWLLFLLRAWEQTLLVTWRAKKQHLRETFSNAVSRFVSLLLLIYSMDNSVSLIDLLTFQSAPLLYVIPFLLMKKDWFTWKFPFWKPGLVLAFSQLSWLLYYRVDQVMIEWMLSYEKVGVYEIAYRSFEAAVMPAALLLATPMALYARSSGTEALSICQQQAKRMLAWGGLGLIGACVAAVFLSFLYSKPSFTQLPATVSILALGVIPVFLGSLYSQLLILKGHEIVFAKITLLITALNLILNYLFLPVFGINGAAIATVACEILVFLSCFALFRQKVLIQQVESQ